MIETERLTIRRMEEADASFMLTLLNDPGWIANIGDRGVHTTEAARAYIHERATASYAAYGFGYFAVLLKTGVPIGSVSLVRREGLDKPDLGFAFLREWVGRGYGEEAARVLIGWARANLEIGRLLAITALDNPQSIRLLGKLGFVEKTRVTLPGHDRESRPFEEALDRQGCDGDTAQSSSLQG